MRPPEVCLGGKLLLWVDELEKFHWEILLPYFCSRFLQTMLPRVWWILGSQRVGKVGLANLTCRWFMSTNLFQQDDVLGLIALGCHWIMSTTLIGGVITGSLGKG